MTTMAASHPLTMPHLQWPVTCGASSCYHVQCMRWRENATRRCSECDQIIAPGERFIEHRDFTTKALTDQRHVTCPAVTP